MPETVNVIPKAIATAAPNAAPDEMPSTCGSASGFRKSACMTTPAAARPPPTSPARSTRGRRIFQMMSLFAFGIPSRSFSLFTKGSFASTIRALCANGTGTAPTAEAQITTMTRRSTRLPPVNVNVDFLSGSFFINCFRLWFPEISSGKICYAAFSASKHSGKISFASISTASAFLAH